MAMHYESKPVMSSEMPSIGGIVTVNETTPNLKIIQSFPVVSRDGNFHIHQDPNSGQMYRMTQEFHQRIPEIILNRNETIFENNVFFPTGNFEESKFISRLVNRSLAIEPAKPSPIFSVNGEPVINRQKNNNSFYLLFSESSSEIAKIVKNKQFISNIDNQTRMTTTDKISSPQPVQFSSNIDNQTRVTPVNKISSPQPVQFSSNIVNQTRMGPMNKIPNPQPVQFSSNIVNQTRMGPMNRVI